MLCRGLTVTVSASAMAAWWCPCWARKVETDPDTDKTDKSKKCGGDADADRLMRAIREEFACGNGARSPAVLVTPQGTYSTLSESILYDTIQSRYIC